MFNHINILLEYKIIFKNIASSRQESGLVSLFSSRNCITIYHNVILNGVVGDF